MSNPLCLLVHDPVLSGWYSHVLRQTGFSTLELSPALEPIRLPDATRPESVLIDPVFFSDPMRPLLLPFLEQCTSLKIPVHALPTPLEPLARSARSFGVPALSTQSPVREALGVLVNDILPGRELAGTEPEFQKQVLDGLHESLALFQAALRGSAHLSAPELVPAEQLLHAHSLALLAGVAEPGVIFRVAKAILQTVFERFQPAPAPASIHRTLAQGADLLSMLLDPVRAHFPEDLPPVLVVEDDPNTSQLICAALEIVELTAMPALTAEKGLTLAESDFFGLVLLDIGLPSMSGLEFCRQLRALPLHQHTPVVFLTGLTDLPNRVQSNLSGGNEFVCKPFNVHELGLKALLWNLRRALPGS